MSPNSRFIKVASALIACYAVSTTAHSQLSPDVATGATKIVTIGQYQPGAFSIPNGEMVMAVTKGVSGNELIHTTITIDTVYNQSTGDTSALSVAVAAQDSVLFILYSEEELGSGVSPGSVTSFEDAAGFYYPGKQKAFWVMSGDNQEWWMLSATGIATDSRESMSSGDTYPLKIRDYTLKLHNHPKPTWCDQACRTLVEVETILDESISPVVLWAGDLNRDGKLDLILDLRSNSEVGGPVLYLSTGAEDGGFARPVTWLAPQTPGGC